MIRDPENVAYIKAAKIQPNAPLFPLATSTNAGDTLKEISEAVGGPKEIMVKDLRTLKAHMLGREAVKAFPGPPPPLTGDKKKDVKLIKAAILQMATVVSNVLNNEPTESRDTYVHPDIWTQWQESLTNG